MQDKIVLGFLKFRPMTSYDIKKALEKSTSFFYNASLGSINPALKKNITLGNVTVDERIENGRAKKEYTITEKGEETFIEWLAEDINISKIKDEALLKLFFLGELSQGRRERLIANYIGAVEEELQRLQERLAHVQQMEIPPEVETQAEYQIATLQFGIDYYLFVLQWYEKNILKR